MSRPVLRYLLVQELDAAGRVRHEDVERYTAGEYLEAFTLDEQRALDSGKLVHRDDRRHPDTSYRYADMFLATRRWHREPTEAMLRAGVQKAMDVKLSADYKWPDYMHDLWTVMREAAL